MKIPRGVAIALGSLLVAAAPVGVAIGADALGGVHGCEVNEGGVSTCLVAGVDIGRALASAFVLGWLTVLVLPFAGLGVIGGIAIAIFDATRKR